MSEVVPDGWALNNFGTVAGVINGFAFKSDDFTDNPVGNFAVVRMSNLKNGIVDLSDAKYVRPEVVSELNRFRLDEDAFLFGMSGSLDNYGWISEQGTICYQNQRVGRLVEYGSDTRFCAYLFLSEQVRSEIEMMAVGAAQLNISASQLESIPVLIPPLPEQQKIAAILTSVDDVIEKTEAQISKLQDLKKGMMQELLTKGIGHTEFKDSPVGRIPKGWDVATCGALCAKVTDGEHLSPTYVTEGYPILSAKDVTDNGVDFSTAKNVSLTDFEKMRNRCNPETGDVLIISRGATIGKTTLNISDRAFALMGSVILLKPLENICSGRYLSHYLQLSTVQNSMLQLSGSSAQQAIYLKDIKNLHMPVPPLSEQRQISSAIDGVYKKIRSLREKLKSYRLLKKALMQDLLTGKVRVKVN